MDSTTEKKKVTFEYFHEVLSKNSDIQFEDASFEFPISFIYPNKTSIQKNFTFKNCQFVKIEFQNVIFVGKVYFQSCQIENEFTANNCKFSSQFLAYHISAKRVVFWDNDFEKGFEVYNYQKIEDLILQSRKVSGKINITQWNVNPTKLNKVHITFEKISESSITISSLFSKNVEINFPGQLLTESVWIGDIKAEELKLVNLKNKSNNKISLVRINAWKLHFIWLHNDGWLSLQEFNRNSLKEGSLFSIQDSYLGNAELYHIDLNSYEQVKIFNCHLQNIIPVNVKWNFNLDAYKDIKPEYLKEFFRQLKNVSAKNMDKISQLQFEKMEILFYSTQLNWRENFQDWFILKSNQISNNHGLSWIRPLFWLLGLSFIFYTIINYISGDFGCYHIGNYLYFLLPLHNVNELLCIKASEINNRNWIYFWDITQKLVSGYLIFQFLRAFRKFVS